MAKPDGEMDATALYRGLKALVDTSFPRKCAMCGHVYNTVDEFVANTVGVVSGSGLKESNDENDLPVVELFRNCACGSTLMDCFSDRRDVSEKGTRRRKAFSNIQALLVRQGLSPYEARNEILRLMKGEKSSVIEKLGVRVR